MDKAKFSRLMEINESVKRKRKAIERCKAENKDDAETYWYERNLRVRNSLSANLRY